MNKIIVAVPVLALTAALAACSSTSTSTSALSAADRTACSTVNNIQSLANAAGGGSWAAPNAIYISLATVQAGTSQPLNRDLQAAAKANVLGTTNLVPDSLNAAERDCKALGT
jgi:hypothetical protein